jgi:imidazole glycerol-phosphate synthase subunit HisH
MTKRVAIIDYGVGNLFSVKQACGHVSLEAVITNNPEEVGVADAIILPGVGAFGFAMQRLEALAMTNVIRAAAGSGKPIVGICLGFQLLFDSSSEGGRTSGLGLIAGEVKPLRYAVEAGRHEGRVRTPNVNWLPISASNPARSNNPWSGALLDGVEDGADMYFVHSYFALPSNQNNSLATARYCGLEYCCVVERENVFGCQFHPEKSAAAGLQIYRNLAQRLAIT